jgi:tartrate dehydrogenase/decarboxylase/D-malate dehydrogenase
VSGDHRYRVAVIPGDGIGREVIPAALAVLEAVTAPAGIRLETTEFPWGCDHYRRTGRMLDEGGFDRLREFDAIYFGAVGSPGIPDHVSVWELILPIRQRFDQYVNLRPIRLLPGVAGPLAGRGPPDLDMLCVRERTPRSEYSAGRPAARGHRLEVSTETAIFTHSGISASSLRLPKRRRAPPPAGQRHQVQRDPALDGAVDEVVAVAPATRRSRCRSTTWTRSPPA